MQAKQAKAQPEKMLAQPRAVLLFPTKLITPVIICKIDIMMYKMHTILFFLSI